VTNDGQWGEYPTIVFLQEIKQNFMEKIIQGFLKSETGRNRSQERKYRKRLGRREDEKKTNFF